MNSKAELERLLGRARALTEKAKTGDLTAAEAHEAMGIPAQCDALRAEAAKSGEPLTAIANLWNGKGTDHTDPGGPVFLPGVTEGFKTLHTFAKARAAGAVEVAFKDSTNLDERATSTALIPGDYPTAGPSVLGLFPNETATAPTQRVYRVTTTATAAQVLEGARKPDAGLLTEPVDVELVKIATTHRVTDELVEDQPQFMNALPAELIRAVTVAENAYAVTTILGTSGLLTVTPVAGVGALDGIADAIASLQTAAGVDPSGVVLNPLDVAAVRKAREGTDGQYLTDPFSAGGKIHGLTPVVSNSVAQNTLLVGSFRTAGIAYRRSGVRLATQTTEDDFMVNKVTLRAEERVALGITRPGHIARITLS